MAKRELGPWPWVAGAVALAAGGLLVWSRTQDDEKPAGGPPGPLPPAPPGEQYDCEPGYVFDAATQQCVPTGGGAALPPSLLPVVDKLKGPMLPPRAKILMVGGDLAAGLAPALVEELKNIESSRGYQVTPSAVTVWGTPGFTSFEELSKLLNVAGVPRAPECEACPPDLVIIFAGEYNLHWGPVDKRTSDAISHLTDAFAMYADKSPRAHLPNIFWIGPPANPDFDPPPNQSALSGMVLASSTAARPGQSAYLSLKKFERSYPHQPVTGMFGAEPMMVDNATPNAAGYANIARQAAAVLVAWYASHPGAASA